MNCGACEFDNPAGLKFCGNCGERLPAGCPSCGFENPAGFRFCGECGTALAAEEMAAPSPAPRNPRDYTPPHLADKILQSKSALEGERKQVTVLFADVKGSMELAEEVGAEAWHRMLEPFFAILTEGVHRFEGTINQYTGDGVMALFGAPIAHEDHAQRACYAALQLGEELARYATEVKREHGVTFSARMGIHSGEVVVGKIGDDLRMDYTAQGHTVGLAQRMESLASPDTCYLTAATAALVEGYFELEDLGDFSLKGVSEPVRVHRLLGAGAANTRFDISRARGLTRFVGRGNDMAVLQDALAQAQAGNGQVVGIVAEAGTGKSRLSFEFMQHCRAQGLAVNQGTALPHGKNIPYLPMLQVFRGYYGIQEQDDDRTVREKIAGRMLLLDEEFREVLPVLFEFFGVPDPERPVPPMDPEAKQRQIFSVLRRLVQGADPQAGSGRFVTLIEDLHWLDPGSEALLEQWVDAVAGSSAFLVVNFRPEYHADWMQKSYYRQLPLTPLGPDAIRELLSDLLGDDPSIRGLAGTIHERTGGNPFFTEEVVQSLIESGQLVGSRGRYRLVTAIDRLDVPASVQSILAARIDRLRELEKQVLQAAAVIGNEFAEPILREASEVPEPELRAALTALKSAEFVFEQSLYPIAEYAFKHPLTQEVALGSQLAERRSHRHAAVARALEKAHAEKLDEIAALLAHHWEEAGDALRASRWHARAAVRVSRNDPVQGVRHMQRVMALTAGLPASQERDALRLAACTRLLGQGGWRVGLSFEQAEEIYAEGRELTAGVASVAEAIALRVGYGATLGLTGNVRRYYELASEAVSLVDEQTPPGPASAALGPCFGYSALLIGDLEGSRRATERAVALAEGDPHAGVETVGFSVWGQALQTQASSLAWLGELDRARDLAQQAMEVSREHSLLEALGWSVGTSIEIMMLSGEAAPGPAADLARQHAFEGVQLAESSGSPYQHTHAYRALGFSHLIDASWSDAVEALEHALANARAQSGREIEAELLSNLSAAHLGAGDASRACACAEEAIAAARERGTLVQLANAELALARALGEQSGAGAATEIEECLDRSQAAVDQTGARVLEPQILEARACLHALRGAPEQARVLKEQARVRYVEVGAEAFAKRLEQEFGARQPG